MYKFILVILAIAISTEYLQAQPPGERPDEQARRIFYVDYAAFRDSLSQDVTLEVYYKIFSAGLSYNKWGDKYKANYSVDITVNHKKKQVTGISKDGEMVADSYKQTRAPDDFIINRVVFKVLADDYEINAYLSDPLSGGLSRVRINNVNLKEFKKNSPQLSILEFVRESKPIESDSQFVRSDMTLIPSVSRIYGEEVPEMVTYYEIYNTADYLGNYTVIYDLHAGDRRLLSDTVQFSSRGAATGRIEQFRVDSYPPGAYVLDMAVQSADKKLNLRTKGDFIIGWSVMSIVKNDWKTAVAQLRYVASSEELKKLAATASEDHVKSWEDFWKKKDPTPSTEENELKDEYYKRIRYSDLNFGTMGRAGWKTDMGMVYVIYGPPDEIERHPFDIDSKPYQIWYYYTTRRVFTFIDLKGYGDFELAYPYDGNTQGIR